MATNRVFADGYHLSVVVTNPTTPVSGDPVRFGLMTGVALTDEGDGGNATTKTSVDFGPSVWRLTVDDNLGTGIAVGAAIYYHDTGTGTGSVHLNNDPTGANAFFGFAMETVSANATTAIEVIHVALGFNSATAGLAGTSELMTEVTLTSAQVKALKGTPITLVAAPGADLAIVPMAVNIVVNYGGTNAFTETADDLSIGYAGGAELMEIESTGLIDQTNDEWRFIEFTGHDETFIPVENAAVVITNLDDEIAGNAGADNTVKVRLYYRVVPTDA